MAADYESDFVLLPELFTVQLLSHLDAISPQEGMKKLAGYTHRFVKAVSSLAKRYGITIIAGSHISYCRLGGVRIQGGEIRNLQITGNDIEYNNATSGGPGASCRMLVQ